MASDLIAGICGGLAVYFGMDVALIRIIAVLLFLFAGLSLWVYPILWAVIPEEPVLSSGTNGRNGRYE